jgi:hypothetical protein
MSSWDFAHWLHFGGIMLIIFVICGGIISQTTEGMSWQGWMAGMWKGVEWFLIVVFVGAALFFGYLGIMYVASSMNA